MTGENITILTACLINIPYHRAILSILPPPSFASLINLFVRISYSLHLAILHLRDFQTSNGSERSAEELVRWQFVSDPTSTFSFFFLSVGKGSVFQTRGSSMDHPLWGRVKAPFELSIQSRYFQLDTFRNAIIEKIGLIERLDSSIERTFFPRIFRVFRRIRRGQFPLTVNCLEKERNLVLDRSEEKKETSSSSDIIFRRNKV